MLIYIYLFDLGKCVHSNKQVYLILYDCIKHDACAQYNNVMII